MTEVCNTLKSFQDNAMHEVERKLWKQVQGMESDLQKLKMLRTALLKVISIYDSCEDAIVSLDEGRQSVDQGLFGNVDLQKYVNIIEKTGIRFK